MKLTFGLMLAIGFIACDKDDDQKDCTRANWVGTYEGTIECDGVEEDVIVTISASGTEDIIIEYETSTVIATYDPLPTDKCDFDHSTTGGGISLSVDARLNNDNFTLEEIYTVGGLTTNCNINATRQ